MERRTLLAVVLSFIVVYAYQAFFMPKPVPAPPPQAVASGTEPTPALPPPTPTTESAPTPPPARVEAVVVGDTEERDFILETGKVKAVFTNRGGRLRSWVLKAYMDSAGKPVDLVAHDVPPDLPLPFSLRLDENDLTRRLNTALFRSDGVTGGAAAPSVSFEFQDASGLTVRKSFRLNPQSYLVTFDTTVKQGDRELVPSVQWGPGPGDLTVTGGGGFFTPATSPPPEALVHNGTDVERIGFSGVGESPVREGTFVFAGIDDHYFVIAAITPRQARVEYRTLTLPVPEEGKQRQLMLHTLRLPTAPTALNYYIGPKSFDDLKAVHAEFVRAINWGFFSFLAVPFLSVLKWIHGYVGNYGWAIILLTILMNVVIFPLRHKSAVSMRKMQQLQPQLKAIQDRYADLKVTDPARQKMNSEMMGLYKERGVNPASGCIPMLLTMPVLFAFYQLLSQAIEIRGAPFGLWIHDLSKHDPYYVTPLLMGATMFWQQRMTPMAGDPAQQRIMMFMPLIFVAMFLQFPSGLAIYYFVNTLWGIGQQYFTNWLLGAPIAPAPRPAAERRLKNAGAGRSERAEKNS